MGEHWGTTDWQSLDRIGMTGEAQRLVPYPILFMGFTGSHSWGLATPDSDVDIRGVYVKPLDEVLALDKGQDTVERQGDVDVQFYEVEKVCRMVRAHNGNIVELALSPTVFYATEAGEDFRTITRKFLTRRLRDYYAGYATSQRRRAAKNRGGKAFVYAFREMFTGIKLMRTGEIEYDFRRLWSEIERESVFHSDLLPRVFYRPRWKVVDAVEMAEFNAEWEQMIQVLDRETAKSPLPETYDGYTELNDLLLRIRRNGI